MEQIDSVGLCAMEQLDLSAGHLSCLGLFAMEQMDSVGLCAVEQMDSMALCSGAAGLWGFFPVEQMDSVGLCAMEQLDLTAGHLGCLGLCAMEQMDSVGLCAMEQLDLSAGHLGCLGLCAMEQMDSVGLVQWSNWWSKHKKYVNVLINTCRTCRLLLRIICTGLRKALTVSLCMLLHDTSYAGCTAVPCTMPCLSSPHPYPNLCNIAHRSEGNLQGRSGHSYVHMCDILVKMFHLPPL